MIVTKKEIEIFQNMIQMLEREGDLDYLISYEMYSQLFWEVENLLGKNSIEKGILSDER